MQQVKKVGLYRLYNQSMNYSQFLRIFLWLQTHLDTWKYWKTNKCTYSDSVSPPCSKTFYELQEHPASGLFLRIQQNKGIIQIDQPKKHDSFLLKKTLQPFFQNKNTRFHTNSFHGHCLRCWVCPPSTEWESSLVSSTKNYPQPKYGRVFNCHYVP